MASALVTITVAVESIPLQFPFPGAIIATDAAPNHWAFYFQGFPNFVAEPGSVLSKRSILPCKNYRLLC